LALDRYGHVLSWGYGEDGQLGHGDTKSISVPKMIENHIAQSIYAGHSNSAFMTNQDELYTFGSNWDGRCMLPELGTIQTPQLSIKERLISVSLGISHMGVVLNSGRLLMAGTGTEG
jgi:alpha-tubulin suppressor-like RCC1 family protein